MTANWVESSDMGARTSDRIDRTRRPEASANRSRGIKSLDIEAAGAKLDKRVAIAASELECWLTVSSNKARVRFRVGSYRSERTVQLSDEAGREVSRIRRTTSQAPWPAAIASAVNFAKRAVSKATTKRASVSMITRWGESKNLAKLFRYASSGATSTPESAA